MKLNGFFLTLLIFFILSPIICCGQELTVMIALDENLPSDITGMACEQMVAFLEENNFQIINLEEQNSNQLINSIMNNNEGDLIQIAKDRGALFLICGKLQAMETGTTPVYETVLYELELFGEIKLLTLDEEALPLSIKLKEKGVSVKLQESYQQALGKALESIEKTILSEFKILKIKNE